jgi:hypothetical protein
VPARTSSPIPAALAQPASRPTLVSSEDVADLRRFLGLSDPRKRRGLRYPAVTLLTAAAAAVLVGSRSLVAIGVVVDARATLAPSPQESRSRAEQRQGAHRRVGAAYRRRVVLVLRPRPLRRALQAPAA